MSRVLVTGASGFIGARTLAALAAEGLEIHAAARRPPGSASGGAVRWHAADLLADGAAAALALEVRAELLLHLAWCAEPRSFWTAPANATWTAATVRLLEAFAAAGGRRAVLAGSCAEYDWTQPGPYREHATPLVPSTLYGICKDATRRVAEALGERLDVELAWGRIFFLYGPNEHPERLVGSLAGALVRGERAAVSEGLQVRDFSHVDDVAGAFAALVRADLTGAVNIGSGEAVAVREIARLLGDAAGRADLLDIGALPTRPGEPAEIVADIARLRDEVGFRAAFTLPEGLAQTVDWWRAQA